MVDIMPSHFWTLILSLAMASGEGDEGLWGILDGVLAKEGEGVRKPGERARTRVVVRWRIEELRVEDMSVGIGIRSAMPFTSPTCCKRKTQILVSHSCLVFHGALDSILKYSSKRSSVALGPSLPSIHEEHSYHDGSTIVDLLPHHPIKVLPMTRRRVHTNARTYVLHRRETFDFGRSHPRPTTSHRN